MILGPLVVEVEAVVAGGVGVDAQRRAPPAVTARSRSPAGPTAAAARRPPARSGAAYSPFQAHSAGLASHSAWPSATSSRPTSTQAPCRRTDTWRRRRTLAWLAGSWAASRTRRWPRRSKLVEPGGGLDGVAVAAAARRDRAVAAQLHRVEAGQAHAPRRPGAVTRDVDVDRVAVGDEHDLAGPERARRAAGQAGAGGAAAAAARPERERRRALRQAGERGACPVGSALARAT